MCTHTQTMATKTISIMEDVYERIKAIKSSKESFSDALRRITNKGSIMEFAGAWSNINEEEAKKIENKISELRKGNRLQELM